MLEGLVGRFGGETVALLVWLALAAFAAALLWVAMIVWKGGDLPMRTEKLADGRTRVGALRWLLVFVVVLGFGPLVIMAYRLVVAVFYQALAVVWWVAGHWWLFVLAAAFAAGVVIARSARVRRWVQQRHQPVQVEPLPELPHDPMPRGPGPGQGTVVLDVTQEYAGPLLTDGQWQAAVDPQPDPSGNPWARPPAESSHQ